MVQRFIYIGFLLVLVSCTARHHGAETPDNPVLVPAVHKRYLDQPLPSNGVPAQFNPPVLRWPVTDKEDVLYDVRLSQDRAFEKHVIEASSLQWAMFNPHTRLEHGVWYWQYRVAGEEWSPAQRFTVDESSPELVSPKRELLLKGIPSAHPRVLTTKPEALRELAREDDAQSIVEEATVILGQKIPREDDGMPSRSESDPLRAKKLRQDASSALGKRVFTAVNLLSQAWLISGDKRFADRASAIAMTVAGWDPDGVTGSKTNDFADARCMLAMALVFDTFHNQLSEQQKSRLVDAITVRAGRFYHEWINNQEARLLSGHVWQHILHYFFQSALALYGHHSEAEQWLTYSYELFVARAPILGGLDGGWIEGASYFKMNMETLVEMPLFIKQFTGFDFISTHPWYKNQIDWLVYHVPPGSASDGFGDNAEEVLLPGPAYVAFAREIAKLTQNPLAAWYERKCREYENIDLAGETTLRWVRLTRTHGLSLPKDEDTRDLTTAKVFAEVGLTAMHSDPANTRSNLVVAMRSSVFGCYGHFLADQNAFNILYGGKPVFYRTGYKVAMTDPHRTGWYQHTKSQNAVLVDGEGQPYSTEAFGVIRQFLSGEQVAYALGDASSAYSSEETSEDFGVRKFYRHLLLLKPDIVVIYDQLEAASPVEWSWLIHSMSRIETDESNNTFRSKLDHVSGVGALWSAIPVNFVLSDTFDVPAVNWRGSKDASGKLKTYESEQWHLKAVSAEKASSNRFLAILQIAPGVEAAAFNSTREGSVISVRAGRWSISADVSTDAPASLRIENEDASSVFQLDADQVPTLLERVNGPEQRTEARKLVPWHLRVLQPVTTKK